MTDQPNATVAPNGLRCVLLVEPIAIGTRAPLLSRHLVAGPRLAHHGFWFLAHNLDAMRARVAPVHQRTRIRCGATRLTALRRLAGWEATDVRVLDTEPDALVRLLISGDFQPTSAAPPPQE